MKKIHNGPAKVAKGMIVAGAYLMYRPKFLYTDKDEQNRQLKHPCVVIANHSCVRDAPFLLSVLKGTGLATIVAKDWYEKKELTWLLKGNNCIPVDRYKMDISWLNHAADAIRAGNSVLIFPEGHVTKGREMDSFKSGFVLLAKRAGVPVLPIYLDHEYHAVGKRKKVMIGTPMELTVPEGGMTPDYFEKEADRFRQEILRMQECADRVTAWI